MGWQSELDTGTVLINREELADLRAQLLDAKRNEERVVGELEAALEKARNQINYQCDRKLDAVNVASAMRTTMDAATAKLHTLEAAVRAVRDADSEPWVWRLADLYALVPDGSEGGGS